MNWLFLFLAIFIVVTLTCVLVSVVAVTKSIKRYDRVDLVDIVWCVLVSLGVMTIPFIIVFSIATAIKDEHYNMANFIGQYEFYQTHVPNSELEDMMLTENKTELNSWLYKRQQAYTSFGNWAALGEEVMELEPIK